MPLMPEMRPEFDAITGSELDEICGGCTTPAGPTPGFEMLVRRRTLPPSPVVGVNSLMAASTEASVATFLVLPRKAKYESSMSSKSITPSHSSQRQMGALNGCLPAMSRVSTSIDFSRSQLGQKYGA